MPACSLRAEESVMYISMCIAESLGTKRTLGTVVSICVRIIQITRNFHIFLGLVLYYEILIPSAFPL